MHRKHALFAFILFIAAMGASTPTFTRAFSEPLTLKVCERETQLSRLRECIDEILNEHEKGLAFAVIEARKRISKGNSVQAFDETHSAWVSSVGKECLRTASADTSRKSALIVNAACHIERISERIHQLE